MDYFLPEMNTAEIDSISMLGLAHLGDSVYELMTRTMLCTDGHRTVGDLHRLTVHYVNANAQAEAVKRILPMLSEEENAVFRRGRNTRVNSVPQNSSVTNYHAATGLEALFGWLYLQRRHERLNELFSAIMGGNENAT